MVASVIGGGERKRGGFLVGITADRPPRGAVNGTSHQWKEKRKNFYNFTLKFVDLTVASATGV